MDEHTESGLPATALLRQRHADVKGMFDELLSATSGGSRRELFDCLRASLAVHETAEEIVVYPMVRRLGPAAERVVDTRLAEEQEAKQVLAELERMEVEDPAFAGRLASLRDAVVSHAEAEEREVFPLVEQRYEPEEQRRMGQRIALAERMAPTHPHPHAPSSAAGNLLVGSFMSMVDRVRDALAH